MFMSDSSGDIPTQIPYVISADLEAWGNHQHTGLTATKVNAFRESLVHDLQAMGKAVEWLDYYDIKDGLTELANKSTLPKISLDRFYYGPSVADGMLDITRACSTTFDDSTYVNRRETADLASQYNSLAKQFSGREVAIVDDVLFSGKMAERIVERLADRNIRVVAFIAGVAIGPGAEILEQNGIRVYSHLEYKHVEDELCERDFTSDRVSGRPLIDKPGKRSLYWVPEPFSKHDEMASISNEHIGKFFEDNLTRNIAMFGATTVRANIGDVYGRELIENKIDEIIA
jgi:hypothetical protein